MDFYVFSRSFYKDFVKKLTFSLNIVHCTYTTFVNEFITTLMKQSDLPEKKYIFRQIE